MAHPNAVEIIETPPGQAPDHIRAQWVGVKIPVDPASQLHEDIQARGIEDWLPSDANSGGYSVDPIDAIAALLNAGKTEAAQWWTRWLQRNNLLFPLLVFNKEVCRPMSDEEYLTEEFPNVHMALAIVNSLLISLPPEKVDALDRDNNLRASWRFEEWNNDSYDETKDDEPPF